MNRHRTVELTESSAGVLRIVAAPLLLRWTCALLFCSFGISQSVSSEADMPKILMPPGTQQHTPNMRISSDLVLIPVTVLDKHDSSIIGLEKEHFKLYEDNVEQVITHFAMEDVPMSVGFVFDASGSMTGKLWKSKEAVASFLKAANPEDEFFLVKFNNRVDLALDITQDTQLLLDRLISLQPNGETALLDGVKFSLQQMHRAHNSRKALIVISDGGDNHSRFTAQEIMSAARESDVLIYAIGIYGPRNVPPPTYEELMGPALLRQISKDTAGRLFEVHNVNDLPDVAEKIALTLRNQYVLGYRPSAPKHDGKYHRVRVALALSKGHPKLQTSWRQGYYAPTN